MRALIIAIVTCLMPSLSLAQGVRLKDLATFEGVRGNDLVGYGLVVGLDGTGDGLRNSPFTEDIMSNILEKLTPIEKHGLFFIIIMAISSRPMLFLAR